MARLRFTGTPRERFLARVIKSDGCWGWRGPLVADGYARFAVRAGEAYLIHRYMWEMANGPIPELLNVLHRCDNPICTNPDHLFLGTHTDNMRDMAAKGRHGRYNARKTHCANGHEFSPSNTYTDRVGSRHCRICRRATLRRSYWRSKVAA